MKGLNIIWIFFIWALPSLAQDIHFSQFYAAPLITNPANTGNFNGVARLGGNYRDQWGSITIPYRTFDLYGDAGIQPGRSKNRFGVGAYVLSDQAGDGVLKSNRAMLSTAYHVILNKDETFRLSAGIAGGIVQRSIDYSKLTFDSQWNGYNFDADLANMESGYQEQFNYTDFSAGAILTITPYSFSRYFISTSASHITQPEESFYSGNNQLGVRWQTSAGGFFPISNHISMSPMAYSSLQKKALEVIMGSNFNIALDANDGRNSFLAGIWYRYNDAAWLMLGYMAGNLSVSASYDLNFSGLTTATNTMGGLEVAMVYTFNKSEHKDPLGCPAYE